MRRFETMVLVIGMAAGFVSQSVVSAQPDFGKAPRAPQVPAPAVPAAPLPPGIEINTPDGSMTIGQDGTIRMVTPDGEMTVGKGKKKSKAEAAREKEEQRKEDEKKRAEKRKADEAAIEPTFTVTGGFENSIEKARQSATLAAKEKFHEYLTNLEDPISRDPNLDLIRQMTLATREVVQEEAIKSAGTSGTEMMYRVTMALKVKPEQIRTMRTRERSSEALGIIGLLVLGLFVVAGFFRLDAMTKGYVTTWLMLGMVGVGAMLLGVWTYAWAW